VNKVVDAQIPVLGDVVTNLASLVPLIKSSPRTQWFNDIKSWKEAYPFTYSKESTMVKPQAVIEELDRLTADRKEDVIITTGVGQHQMWAAQHFRWRYPRTMITSGGLGTMGFGLPGAIGAKIAAPEKIVVDVDGDASFSMTAMELQTASQYGVGVKVLILNNDYQGMVVQWQGASSLPHSSSPSTDAAYTDLFYDARYSHTVNKNPDFVKLAEAMNVKAIRLTNPADLPAKMKEFLEYDNTKPIVMECLIEQNEHVFPWCDPFASFRGLSAQQVPT
jgi:acetolactate synthase-1/2/3 large subunit